MHNILVMLEVTWSRIIFFANVKLSFCKNQVNYQIINYAEGGVSHSSNKLSNSLLNRYVRMNLVSKYYSTLLRRHRKKFFKTLVQITNITINFAAKAKSVDEQKIIICNNKKLILSFTGRIM